MAKYNDIEIQMAKSYLRVINTVRKQDGFKVRKKSEGLTKSLCRWIRSCMEDYAEVSPSMSRKNLIGGVGWFSTSGASKDKREAQRLFEVDPPESAACLVDDWIDQWRLEIAEMILMGKNRVGVK